jgi:hypothetical protein
MSKLLDGAGAGSRTSKLPNPVFIAVGEKTVYAFKYKPRFTSFKIKKEAARWNRDQITVKSEQTSMMCYFSIITSSGENYAMEIPTMMGGKELAQMFLDSLTL